MVPDIVELAAFYASPLGKIAAELVTERVGEIWPRMTGAHVAGIGYTPPVLGCFHGDMASTISINPARQGVAPWPKRGPNAAVLADDQALPLADASFNRILVIHALEHAQSARGFLREVWRVLEPEGRVILVVPNRSGGWAQSDMTPFGHGRPFSVGQLRRSLEDSLFRPLEWTAALHVPPYAARPMNRAMRVMERPGWHWWSRFGGVIIVEAEKNIYGGATVQVATTKRRYAAVVGIEPRTMI